MRPETTDHSADDPGILAFIIAAAPDQARVADLHVFDLAVRDLGGDVGSVCRVYQQPVLSEPHVTPIPRRGRRLRDEPAEVNHVTHDGYGTGIELQQRTRIQCGRSQPCRVSPLGFQRGKENHETRGSVAYLGMVAVSWLAG
jgi:hypothetical protein